MRLRLVLVGLLVLTACGNQGNVFSLEPGTCFDDIDAFFDDDSEGVSDVPTVDCAEPHDNEVFATYDLPDGDFPGQEAIATEAEEECIERFEDYVGIAYPESRFISTYLIPTAQGWEGGDREVVCFLYDIDLAKIEGSAEGLAE
jgi:Septum formation